MIGKRYLGDGLYADCDGYQIVLTAEDGIRVTNTVYIDSDVWRALQAYHRDLIEATARRDCEPTVRKWDVPTNASVQAIESEKASAPKWPPID